MITPETREIIGGDADEEKIRSTETLLKRLFVCYVLKKSMTYLRVVDELAVPVPGGDGHGFFFF
jgi:hypothetical protein